VIRHRSPARYAITRVKALLAVVGHTARDHVDSFPPRPGGVPLYAAKALRALGEPGVIVTRCAEADRSLLDPLYDIGLPVVWHPEPETPVFVIRNLPGGRELEIGALGESWTEADARGWVGSAIAEASWVHAGPLWRGEFTSEALAELRRGRRLSFDGQGLVRPGQVGPIRMDSDADWAVLEHVDVLHLSEREAGALGLELNERSLRTLGVREIVITLGERGSVVYADDLAELIPATTVPVRDPTGAGDGFIAAYCASRLRGHGPVSAARRATQLMHGLLSGILGAW
jgi:sugar/nucleoside kinase (ribokinase family)